MLFVFFSYTNEWGNRVVTQGVYDYVSHRPEFNQSDGDTFLLSRIISGAAISVGEDGVYVVDNSEPLHAPATDVIVLPPSREYSFPTYYRWVDCGRFVLLEVPRRTMRHLVHEFRMETPGLREVLQEIVEVADSNARINPVGWLARGNIDYVVRAIFRARYDSGTASFKISDDAAPVFLVAQWDSGHPTLRIEFREERCRFPGRVDDVREATAGFIASANAVFEGYGLT